MQAIKTTSFIFLILLGVSSLVALFLGGFIALFAVAFGILFLYYLLIYTLLKFYQKRKNKKAIYIVFVFFLIPIIWMILDFEGLFDFLLQGIELDMK